MVTINGEKVQAHGISLADYLKQEGYDIARVAVEKNMEIVTKKDYETTILQDGDCVEIVSFVGGG